MNQQFEPIHLKLLSEYNNTTADVWIEVIEELQTVQEVREKIMEITKIPKKHYNLMEIYIDCQDICGVPSNDNKLMRLVSIKDLQFQYVMQTNIINQGEDAPLSLLIKYRKTLPTKRKIPQQTMDFEMVDAVMRENQPKRDPLYMGSKNVFCEFCKVSLEAKEETKILGRMYGPYKLRSGAHIQSFYVHHLCALWSGLVYVKGEKLQNLQQALLDSMGRECGICGGMGASLSCKKSGCQFAFHPRCFLLNFRHYIEVFSVLQARFQFYCEKHSCLADVDKDFCRVAKELEEMQNNNKQQQLYQRAFESSYCEVCHQIDTDIYCERCPANKGFYHFGCLGVSADNIDNEKQWFCEKCSSGMDTNYKKQFIGF